MFQAISHKEWIILITASSLIASIVLLVVVIKWDRPRLNVSINDTSFSWIEEAEEINIHFAVTVSALNRGYSLNEIIFKQYYLNGNIDTQSLGAARNEYLTSSAYIPFNPPNSLNNGETWRTSFGDWRLSEPTLAIEVRVETSKSIFSDRVRLPLESWSNKALREAGENPDNWTFPWLQYLKFRLGISE